MNKFFAAACLLAVFTMPARAEKINLVADDRVEWHQNEQKMVVAAHLDWPVARVGHAQALHGQAGVEFEVARGGYDFARFHEMGWWTVTSFVPLGKVPST